MTTVSENNGAIKTPPMKGEQLLNEIAIVATRIGRASSSANGDKLQKLILALGLLNHAQPLVEFKPSRARQLLARARKHL